MAYLILSPVVRDVSLLNRWLKQKGCPEYADMYRHAGAPLGVAWDVAIFQSCLETGFFTFRGDVSKDQNNFAGIGATGGGEPGESFATPLQGILAQCQHLACYAGVDVPEADLVAARTRKVKPWILGKATTWEQLAGRWAADQVYWQKIRAIMQDFDDWAVGQSAPGYWVDLFADGKAYLMKASAAVDMVDTGKLVNKLAVITEEFGGKAGQFAIAPDGKAHPEIVHEQPLPGGHIEVDPEHGQPGAKLAWIPWALDYARIATPYVYPDGHPSGAIVHHTAGGTITSSLSYLRQMGYPCLGIGRDGKVYQPFPLTHGGPHSGTWHHRHYVGIEVAGWGRLTQKDGKFWSWAGYEIPAHRVREIKVQTANQQPGFYEMWTEAQEASLLKLLLWLKVNAPGVFELEHILGHDEVAPSRKNDPGGSMSMTMPALRARIQKIYTGLA